MKARISWLSYLFFLQACLIKAKLEWNGDIFSSATKKTGRWPQSSKIVKLPKSTIYSGRYLSTRCLCLSRYLSRIQTPSDLLRKSSERLTEKEMFVRPSDIVRRIFENFRLRVGIKIMSNV